MGDDLANCLLEISGGYSKGSSPDFFSLIFVMGMSEMRGLPPSGHVNENIDADSWV